jgi:hypothetical protein
MNKLLIFTAFLVSGTAGHAQSFVGHAYDIDSNELLYIEEHTLKTDTLQEVIYSEPDGIIFGKKSIDYSNTIDKSKPAFTQTNARNGESITIGYTSDSKVRIHYQENGESDTEEKVITLAGNGVIDAGFDHTVRNHWEELNAGKVLVIDYLVPTRLDTISLEVKKTACAESSSHIYQVDTRCFVIQAESWLIGLLMTPLQLRYKTADQSLLTFKGRSNICDKDGNYQDVVIRYSYPSSEQEKTTTTKTPMTAKLKL